MDPLELTEDMYTTAHPTTIVLCDEHTREDIDAFVSITTETDGPNDESWGVFLTREQAFAMWAWLYGMLYGEPRWSDKDFGSRIRDRVTIHVPPEVTEEFIRGAHGQ